MSTKVKTRKKAPPARKVKATEAPPAADTRRTVMLTAAFEAFVKQGVSGATTDEIARRACVSKREIYRIFGSKEGLFAELVAERGRTMHQGLELVPPTSPESALAALERFGREFLNLLTAPSSIAVYRMAIAEASSLPELGRQLDVQGREVVRQGLQRWLADARQRQVLRVSDPERAAGSFLAILMGDLPLRLMLGAIKQPEPAELAHRAGVARIAFQRLWLPTV